MGRESQLIKYWVYAVVSVRGLGDLESHTFCSWNPSLASRSLVTALSALLSLCNFRIYREHLNVQPSHLTCCVFPSTS